MKEGEGQKPPDGGQTKGLLYAWDEKKSTGLTMLVLMREHRGEKK